MQVLVLAGITWQLLVPGVPLAWILLRSWRRRDEWRNDATPDGQTVRSNEVVPADPREGLWKILVGALVLVLLGELFFSSLSAG